MSRSILASNPTQSTSATARATRHRLNNQDEPIPPRPSRHSLRNKVAIVTGAGSRSNGIGNGRASAVLLAEAGCNVVCVDLNLPWAERTVQMINDEGREAGFGNAVVVCADVTQAEECERVVREAVRRFGRVDVLVNNVGVGGPPGDATTVKPSEWVKGLQVNVTSMMLMAKYAIPAMQRNKRGPLRGSIINIGSVAGLKGGSPGLLYPTSKGAITNMTRAMAAHHAPAGIRVNCVCPGMLYTPMMYHNGMTPQAREARRQRSLLKTEGYGWDCGAAVRWLASEEARWVTGVILPVDAGVTAAVETDLPEASIMKAVEKAKL